MTEPRSRPPRSRSTTPSPPRRSRTRPSRRPRRPNPRHSTRAPHSRRARGTRCAGAEEEHTDEAPRSAEPAATEGDDETSVPADDEPRLAEPATEPEAEPSPRSRASGAEPAADRRSVRGRGPARRRRPLRVHRPRRELPRRPRGARRRRDPRRRDPARGRGRVHGRGLRTADRQAGGLPRHARGWRRPTSRSGSTPRCRTRAPMFAIVGQVERSLAAARHSRRSTRPGPSAGSRSGRPSHRRRRACRRAVGEAVQQALGGRPGPVLLSLPEDLLDEIVPGETPARRSAVGTAPVRRTTRSAPCSSSSPAARAAGDPGRRRRPASADVDGPVRLRRAAARAGRRVVAARGRHLERPSALPRHGRLGAPASVRERLDAADALLVLGCRLDETTTFGYASRRAGSAGRTSTSFRAGRRPTGRPTRSITADARAFLRAADRALLGRRRARCRSASTRGTPATRSTVRPGRRRRSSTTTRGTGRASIRVGRRDAPPGAAGRRDRDDRRRQLRGLGRRAASGSAGPGTFLGSDIGSDGLRRCRPRSRRRWSTAIGRSWRSSAMAAWG